MERKCLAIFEYDGIGSGQGSAMIAIEFRSANFRNSETTSPVHVSTAVSWPRLQRYGIFAAA